MAVTLDDTYGVMTLVGAAIIGVWFLFEVIRAFNNSKKGQGPSGENDGVHNVANRSDNNDNERQQRLLEEMVLLPER